MTTEHINEFAKENGYERAEYVGVWRGFEVYAPIFHIENAHIGIPISILVKGDTIRFTSIEETFECFDEINHIGV